MMRKKIVSLAAAVLMIASVAIPANASSKDRVFEFKFDLAHSTWNTNGYSKDNNTSSYVKTNWIPAGGYQVYVDGYNGSSYVDCTVRTAYIQNTGEGLVDNMVYESGYRTARLGGQKAFANTYASGVWSPDSVGNYQKYNQ